MRSSRGGVHGKGGRHISGAERIVSCESVENFCIPRLTTGVRHAILTVLTHLIQQEAPMFHLIFLIPVLVVLLLGILLLAVLCSR